jgi:hypothetical protein
MERRKHANYIYKIGVLTPNSSTIMNSLWTTYESVRQQFGWRSIDLITLAKADLVQNGPFTLCFRVYEGFLHYFSGIYKIIEDLETLLIYDHCVKIIGYGIEPNGQQYFLAVNSWGEWAEDGIIELV